MSFYWVKVWLLHRKITEALLVASKEIGLEAIAEKAKNMVMSRD